MTKELTQTKATGIEASLQIRNMDIRQFRVIKEILYPNVQKDETLLMAIDYCKARNLDIMKRTIQIVPICDSKTKSMKDTIWPSIAEIRITATRTGLYAGRSEAEFGDEITENLGGAEVTYPRWCKITVWRLVKGEKYAFSAKLFWKQEYKTAKNDTLAPNSMWMKRSYSQLEKCTEAAAFRMAFPEEVGNDYIAEEAFDANEGMLNVTPKSKTASAHNPPASLISEPIQMDIEEAVEEIKEVDAKSVEISDRLFRELLSFTTERAVNNYLNNAKDDLAYLEENAPESKAKIIALASQKLEEVTNVK